MNRLFIILVFLLSLGSCQKENNNTPIVQSTEPQFLKGKDLFESKCYGCHRMENRLAGPPLKNLTKKYSKEWLISFIVDNKKLIENKDSKAIKIWEEYNKAIMPRFKGLTADELDALYYYLEKYKPEEK